MTDAQRKRYEAAWYRLLRAMTRLDAMVHEFPEPAEADEQQSAAEVDDLAARLEALTAVWVYQS